MPLQTSPAFQVETALVQQKREVNTAVRKKHKKCHDLLLVVSSINSNFIYTSLRLFCTGVPVSKREKGTLN